MTGRIIGIALALTLQSGPTAAQDAATALARAESAYASVQTLSAEFTQVITNPMLGGPERSQGMLYLERPGRFAMRFSEPVGDRIVVDGRWLWLYTPSTVPDQVIRGPIPRTGTSTPDLFAQFVERPAERYEIAYVGVDSLRKYPLDVVRLTPRREDMGFTEATVAIGRRDGLIRRILLREPSGQHRALTFTNIRTGVPVQPKEFRFDVPRGTRVVTP